MGTTKKTLKCKHLIFLITFLTPMPAEFGNTILPQDSAIFFILLAADATLSVYLYFVHQMRHGGFFRNL